MTVLENYLKDHYTQKIEEPKPELKITISDCYSGVDAVKVLPEVINDILARTFRLNYEF